MNVTQVSFNGINRMITMQKSVSFHGTTHDSFTKQQQEINYPEEKKLSFTGFILKRFKAKEEPQNEGSNTITKDEITRLAKSGKLSVDTLNTYTPESLLALPEEEKEALWFARGIIIGEDGIAYKEPLTSNRYQ